MDLTLFRVLIEAHAKPLIGQPAWTRFDVVVLAHDQREARLIALREMRTTGDRRRVVPDSLVPVVADKPRVVMQQHVTW